MGLSKEDVLGKPLVVDGMLLYRDPATTCIDVTEAEDDEPDMPVLCRHVGGELTLLSPLSLVPELRNDLGEIEAHVLEGVTDADAKLLAELGEWWRRKSESDEWRDQAERFRVKLNKTESRPWMHYAGISFMAAALGTNTSTLHRVEMVQRKGARELRSLVDEGYISLRTASDYLNLPIEEQARAAEQVKATFPMPPGSSNPVARILSSCSQTKQPATVSLVHSLESHADAVEFGAVTPPSMETAERLMAAAQKIMLAAARREAVEEVEKKGLCG